MKTIRVFVISAGFLLTIACSRTPHPAAQILPITIPAGFEVEKPGQHAISQVGRFQLLAAEHLIVPQGTPYTDKDVFRIDTATGSTQILVSATNPKGGKHQQFWAPIAEYSGTGPAPPPAKP